MSDGPLQDERHDHNEVPYDGGDTRTPGKDREDDQLDCRIRCDVGRNRGRGIAGILKHREVAVCFSGVIGQNARGQCRHQLEGCVLEEPGRGPVAEQLGVVRRREKQRGVVGPREGHVTVPVDHAVVKTGRLYPSADRKFGAYIAAGEGVQPAKECKVQLLHGTTLILKCHNSDLLSASKSNS